MMKLYNQLKPTIEYEHNGNMIVLKLIKYSTKINTFHKEHKVFI